MGQQQAEGWEIGELGRKGATSEIFLIKRALSDWAEVVIGGLMWC